MHCSQCRLLSFPYEICHKTEDRGIAAIAAQTCVSVWFDGFSMVLSRSSKVRIQNAPFISTRLMARVFLDELYRSCISWRDLFGCDHLLARLNAFLRCHVCDEKPLLPLTSFGVPVCLSCMTVLQDSECSRPVFSSHKPLSSVGRFSCRSWSQRSVDS